MTEIISLIIFFISVLNSVNPEEVTGCGGFLKSHVPIDFSKVEVKLITKQGIVKDRTTAAPNNGYYFVPLYDKGEMLLELSPPPGWSFDPMSVRLIVNGENDLCSQGKDINFIFKGFGITGRVDSLGIQEGNSGPEGVTVKLESEGEERLTVTDKNGNFFFTPVYPRKYKVSISHPKWKILKKSLEVTVAESNTELPKDSLVIQGYDVSGSVNSEGYSIKDTVIVLVSKDKSVSKISSCSKDPSIQVETKGNVLCSTTTKENGKYTFETLPNGEYYVLPYYKHKNIYYKPQHIEFSVKNKDVDLTDNFEIIGFSISGRILKNKLQPIANAKIYINNQETIYTDTNGVYILNKIKPGHYKLKVESDNVQFEETHIDIKPSLLQLPDILPSAFKICGTVTSDNIQKITFTKIGTTTLIQTQSSPKDGTFCEYLTPGKYDVRVLVSDTNKDKGLQFYPLVQTIEVSSEKIPNILFSQLKSTITGKVKCLVPRECDDLIVALKTGNENEVFTKVKGSRYTVADMYPGTYEITVLSTKFCWETNMQTINVDSETVDVPQFTQKGYTIHFISSDDTKVTFTAPGDTKWQYFDITKGRSNFCLGKSGKYIFNLEGCHYYTQPKVVYETNSDSNEIILSAAKHTLKLGIQTETDVGPVTVSVKIGTNKIEQTLQYNKEVYQLSILLEPSEKAVVVPQSEILFFTPPILSVEGTDDCEDLGVKFVGTKGKLFEGKIIPPLAGVVITVESSDSERLVIETDHTGTFKFPPLDNKKEYKITALKESYLLTKDRDGNFLAHKLAEVIVEVVDAANNLQLSGVLLSLSGGETYRKNMQTSEDGKISFTSLSPGEYFLRPMMKEYQFEPSSKIIPVQEGQTVNVHLVARRVAYSAYGQIVSLNGEPEVDMIIVAQGLSNCSDYSEEATCESTGQFRIRGLQPYCSYKVFVKGELDSKLIVERTAPEMIEIARITEDVKDLKMVVFRPAKQMDIIVKIYADNVDHYKSLRVKLLRESGSQSLVHTAKIDASSVKITKDMNPGVMLSFPSLPIDRNPYSLQLDSGLQGSKSQFEHFKANESFKYFTFDFSLKDGASDVQIKQTSVWNLVIIFVILICAYNIELIGNFLSDKFNINGLANLMPSQAASSKPVADFYDDAQIDQIVQNINNAKKKPKPKKI